MLPDFYVVNRRVTFRPGGAVCTEYTGGSRSRIVIEGRPDAVARAVSEYRGEYPPEGYGTHAVEQREGYAVLDRYNSCD